MKIKITDVEGRVKEQTEVWSLEFHQDSSSLIIRYQGYKAEMLGCAYPVTIVVEKE